MSFEEILGAADAGRVVMTITVLWNG